MTIRILNSHLINQIAAGEVVERPAAVVKELIENAIDAGATDIRLTVRDGGKAYLCVTDNGSGMTKDDLNLCILRHATSKIPDENLFNIQTLGFRGEALPSIASISRVKISSKHASGNDAWQIAVEGGKVIDQKPTHHPQGTTIEVSDLFYAVPARLKFLKSTVSEWGAIRDVCEKIALSHPDISFTLTHDQKDPVVWLATSPDQRLAQILGGSFVENTIYVDETAHNIRIMGYVGMPTFHHANMSLQYFYVNGRPIKDKVLSSILRQVYQDYLPQQRHPIGLLHIHLPPEDLDVNVHPMKSEVRFRDIQTLRGILYNTIKSKVTHATVAPAIFSQANQILQKSAGSRTLPHETGFQGQLAFQKDSRTFSKTHEIPTYHQSDHMPVLARDIKQQLQDTKSVETKKILSHSDLGLAKAQLFLTYIVAETSDHIVIIDQHAAHERIIFESFKNNNDGYHIQSQGVLIPIILNVKNQEHALVKENMSLFSQKGFGIECYGDEQLVIRQIPALIPRDHIEDLFHILFSELLTLENGSSAIDAAINNILRDMACRHSIRAGQSLTIAEMDALLRQMELCPNVAQCNHGRPTYVKLSKSDVGKLFDR